jgi:micrococcal nuclease
MWATEQYFSLILLNEPLYSQKTPIKTKVYWMFSFSVRSSLPEFDLVDTASYIVDGDTFDISSGERIRLADVDTPERGEYGFYEASDALSSMIYGKTVYLDVDDMYRYDVYDRLVCVIYVEYNFTHYINVNDVLLRYGYAEVSDYPNEFNPYSWSPIIAKPSTLYGRMLGRSLVIGVGITFIGFIILRDVWKSVKVYH